MFPLPLPWNLSLGPYLGHFRSYWGQVWPSVNYQLLRALNFSRINQLCIKNKYIFGCKQGHIGPCIGYVWPGLNFWLNRVLKVSRLCHLGLSNMVMNCPILEPLHGHVWTMLQSCLAQPFLIAVQYFGMKSGQIILCGGHVWPAITFRQP